MADNRDRLRAGAPAARKLPVPPSNKIASNKTGGQTRKSREVSRDADLPTEASSSTVKVRKRSGTPVPRSFFETNNKKIKMTPKHLPSNNTKSKPLNQEIPDCKLIKNKENAKRNENTSVVRRGIERLPLSQGNEQVQGQGPAPKTSGYSPYINIATRDSAEIAAKRMLSASGDDKYYLEQFNMFYENYRACNIETADRLLKLETRNLEQHYENQSLERRLEAMTQEKLNLEDKLSQHEALTEKINQKYINTLKTRVDIEKSCQKQIQETNSLKAELEEKHSEIGHLKAELNNMQETNRCMANVLTDMEVKLKESKETYANLSNQNNKQVAKLEEQKQDVDGLKIKISQLESELNKLQLQNDDIANQLEGSRNENKTLQNSVAQLEDFRNSMIEINEEYYDESVEQKETISSLESALNQKSKDLEELAKRHEELKAANHQQLSLHSKEHQKSEAEANNLREIIKNFNGELQAQAGFFQAEKESLVVKLEELSRRNSSLMDVIKKMENDKKKLVEEEENKANDLKSTISSLKDDLKEEQIKYIGLEHEKNGIIKQLNEKINTICSAVKKPIISSSLPESKKSSKRLERKSQEVKPTGSVVKSTSSFFKTDKSDKITIINHESDFESEDEMPVKILFSKRQNLGVVKPQEPDLFDALKNGTI